MAFRPGGSIRDSCCADIDFAAVYHFGPSWQILKEQRIVMYTAPDGRKYQKTFTVVLGRLTRPTKEPPKRTAKRLEQYINETNPSLEKLMALKPNDF